MHMGLRYRSSWRTWWVNVKTVMRMICWPSWKALWSTVPQDSRKSAIFWLFVTETSGVGRPHSWTKFTIPNTCLVTFTSTENPLQRMFQSHGGPCLRNFTRTRKMARGPQPLLSWKMPFGHTIATSRRKESRMWSPRGVAIHRFGFFAKLCRRKGFCLKVHWSWQWDLRYHFVCVQ